MIDFLQGLTWQSGSLILLVATIYIALINQLMLIRFKGEKGDQGYPGIEGPAGRPGKMGPQGEKGEPGRFDATKTTEAELQWLSQRLNQIKEQAYMQDWGDDIAIATAKDHHTGRSIRNYDPFAEQDFDENLPLVTRV